MSHSTYRWLRAAAAVPAATLVALTLAVPASAQSSADTTPPSAPRNVTSTYYSDRILTTVDWDASTDNVDAPGDLTYIVESDDIYAPRWVVTGGATSVGLTFCTKATVWAVDRAGNASAKVTVSTKTV